MGPFFDANVPVISYRRQSRRAFFPSNANRPKCVTPAEDTALWEVRNQEKVWAPGMGFDALTRVRQGTKRGRARKNKKMFET